ncbi:Gfo/Idh/MocA family protein [Magnetospirillum moscoviense]|uniref:Oxidoreductase n=1 Tax=Magnetospirillum moscoviense TaxID=1437059 RepID=A0A178MWZ8_9PROT|nr:Gfo/Idh/MocA family oxidoreductase [Magnetospirillum moscoviense]OAN55053.1 oxidoreductase [Magnetospirillum moscoviense]
MTVRFALVGCGTIAAKHVEAVGRIADASIVAVCDRDLDTARRLGEKLGVPFFTDAGQMAETVAFDAFSILTPSGDHAGRVLALAPYGRHFVIEKPMALKIDDADSMIAACDQAGAKIFVVKQNRYNPPVVALRQAVEAGRFGKMVMGTVRVRWARHQAYYDQRPWRGTWAQDGGVLTNQAAHHIDMLIWMMGEVESVQAMTATRLADIEAEDTGIAVLRFTSGALGVIEATTGARPKDLEGSLSLLGEKGAVEIGGFFMNELKSWSFTEPQPGDAAIFQTAGTTPPIPAWNLEQYLRGVVGAIRDGRAGLVDGLGGRRSLELINAIYEAAETGRTIPLRFRPQRCRLGGQ